MICYYLSYAAERVRIVIRKSNKKIMPEIGSTANRDAERLKILQELEVSEEKDKVRTGDWIADIEQDPDRYSLTWGFENEKILPVEDELLLELEGSSPRSIHIYKKLMSDQTVSAVWGKIVHEICSKETVVEPFKRKDAQDATDEDKYIAEAFEKQIESLKFNSLTKNLLEAVITGVSEVELKWERSDIGANIVDFKYIEPRRIQFDKQWNPYLITKDDPNVGRSLKQYKRNFLIHRFYQTPSDSPYGNALGRHLYHPVLFLRRAMESWLLAADRFATPLAVAQVTDDATTAERKAIMRRLTNLSREKYILIPTEWNINFIQPSARADFYENQISMYSNMITRLIAGETTTGEASDVGSYGRDAISKSILMTRAAYFSMQLDESLNDQLVRYWVDVNFGKNVPAPKLERRMIDPADNLNIDQAMAIQGYGIPLDMQWLQETYKFKIDEKIWEKGGSAGGMTVPPHEKEVEVTGNVFADLGWD